MTWIRRPLALALMVALAACSGGGSSPGVTGTPIPAPPGSTPTPVPSGTPKPITGGSTPTPTPSSQASTPANAAAYTCPTSDLAAARVAVPGSGVDAVARAVQGGRPSVVAPDRLEVTYDLAVAAAGRTALAARESAMQVHLLREIDFPRTRLATRILTVDPAHLAAARTALERLPSVRNVSLADNIRYPQTVTHPYFTNDPYFWGFLETSAPNAGATPPPPTYLVGPYEENQAVPGQWGMHAIGLEKAFGYSQTTSGSTVSNPSALGSAAVRIALIDTGQDSTHPELQSKIVYQRCFLSDPAGNQSRSNYSTDADGHGTDTAGIAAASSNNSLGFTGAGGLSTIYGYRVGATPSDACADPKSTDRQCEVDTADIADAVLDAVTQQVNVISLSLGGGSCASGTDPDPIEGNAIAEAIAAGIVVVASSGNGGAAGVAAPACDPGVIAVGASALADGQPNGAHTSAGSANAPVEYVASYSNYGLPSSAYHSAQAWGIVAPGGDPAGVTDNDQLHWIENIWTTTPYDTKNFGGDCSPDYPGNGNPLADCRVRIAGTSMAAPVVAGAAALIVGVSSTYQSPAKMKALFCATADDIGDAKEGCGRLNVYRAMATVLGDPQLP